MRVERVQKRIRGNLQLFGTKSTQLEYSNQILERRVENLSNLNSLSRAVLSVLDLDNIINIILDAYFVLTGAKRISLYLWEAEGLINKKQRESVILKRIYFSEEEIKEFTKKITKRCMRNYLKNLYWRIMK